MRFIIQFVFLSADSKTSPAASLDVLVGHAECFVLLTTLNFAKPPTWGTVDTGLLARLYEFVLEMGHKMIITATLERLWWFVLLSP